MRASSRQRTQEQTLERNIIYSTKHLHLPRFPVLVLAFRIKHILALNYHYLPRLKIKSNALYHLYLVSCKGLTGVVQLAIPVCIHRDHPLKKKMTLVTNKPATERQRPNPPSEINVHGEKRLRSHSYASSAVHGSRGILPPTPPLRPDSGFHSTGHSPTGSFASSASFHLSSATGNATRHSSISSSEDPLRRRSSHLSLSPQSAHPSFSQGLQSPFPGPLYPSPNIGSQKPLSERPQLPPTIYYQQPPPSAGLPLNRVPITITPAAHNTPMISPGNPAWQHHHYFPPSNAAPYPQSNDRYICRTCHKAFSRPSSLRIHSHSHTGEKPFRCPHVGCGKAFSVRSNMKRHERGCHSGRSVAPVLA